MTVTCNDFDDMAREIATMPNPGEMHRRTVTNRLYYAMFHQAREIMAHLGYNTNSHETLLRYMTDMDITRNHPDIRNAGAVLSKFKKLRNFADYDVFYFFSAKNLDDAYRYQSILSPLMLRIASDLPRKNSS